MVVMAMKMATSENNEDLSH